MREVFILYVGKVLIDDSVNGNVHLMLCDQRAAQPFSTGVVVGTYWDVETALGDIEENAKRMRVNGSGMWKIVSAKDPKETIPVFDSAAHDARKLGECRLQDEAEALLADGRRAFYVSEGLGPNGLEAWVPE